MLAKYGHDIRRRASDQAGQSDMTFFAAKGGDTEVTKPGCFCHVCASASCVTHQGVLDWTVAAWAGSRRLWHLSR